MADSKSQFETIEGFEVSLKQRVWLLLDKYPNMSPKELCRILGFTGLSPALRRKKSAIMSQYKYLYRKHQWKIRQGLNRLSYHKTRFWGYALKHLDRKVGRSVTDLAVERGWIQTKMKNRALLWKEKKYGRLLWFETGRVIGWIKRPATKGKLKQLLANAFYRTGLVDDINVFQVWSDSFNLKGAHLVRDTGERLPYCRIELLKDSNGIIVITGDKTHPTSIEIEFCYPDWAERNEVALDQMTKAFRQFTDSIRGLSQPKVLKPENDKMIS